MEELKEDYSNNNNNNNNNGEIKIDLNYDYNADKERYIEESKEDNSYSNSNE